MPDQPVAKGPLIEIRNNNATVDLAGHHLSSKRPTGDGAWISDTSYGPSYNIKLRNGSIVTSDRPTVYAVQTWNLGNKRFGHGLSMAASGGNITQYRHTEYVLENLTLEADGVVIVMQGKKNTIRNCKIIGGNGTVNVYGPNLLFEDNEIILNAKDPQKEGDEPPVALYLEDAADSIVRNNRITIKGHAAKTDAIVLKNSPNVQLEGNTIKGTKDVYRLLDERSSVVGKANTAVP
jgi:nitrous oxidase accessory protein NosD